MLKQFDETYSGWGCEGYTEKEVQEKLAAVVAEVEKTRGLVTLNVFRQKMPNGKYRVVNHSTYDTEAY